MDVEACLLSHPLYAVKNRPDITTVSTHSFASVEAARHQLHPLAGSRSVASFSSFTAAGGHLNSVIVRDPPRERLAGSREEPHSERISSNSLDHVAGKSQTNLTSIPIPASTEFYAHLYDEHPLHSQRTRLSPSKSLQYGERKMAKNRRSLSSILVPSFLQQIPMTSPLTSPTSSMFASRMRSQSSASSSSNSNASNEEPRSRPFSITSSRDSPPPDFLLDDDPFACLAPVEPVTQRTIQSQPPTGPTSSPPNPRSPLMSPKKTLVATPPISSSGSVVHPGSPRAFSTARIQPRPASQKPAFASRPSLPSLHTLSTMNVVLTKKVRKGRVGAGLPFEPWDNPETERTSIARVLQDPTFSHTESLPPGSQPLLPSQIFSAPVAEESLSSQELTSLEATDGFDMANSRDGNVSAPFAADSLSLTSLLSLTTNAVTDPGRGVDLVDSANDLPTTDHDEDEDIIDLDYLTHLPLDFDVDPYDGSASSSSSVPYTPNLTTSRNSFEEQFASLGSSRLSSSDLSASLSRSMSLTSNSSSWSSASGSDEHHSLPSVVHSDGIDPYYLDGGDSPGTLTRSSSEDSDVLNSPPDTDYFQFYPAHRYSTGKDSFTTYCQFRNSKDSTLATSPGKFPVLDEEALENQPGTSADTIRASSLFSSASTEAGSGSPIFAQPPPHDSTRDRGSFHEAPNKTEPLGEMVDGNWDTNSNHHHQQQQDMYTHGASLYGHQGSATGFFPSMSFSGRMGGRGDDDDDKRDGDGSRRGINHGTSLFTTPSSSEPTTSEDEESTDDYTQYPERSSSTTASPRESRMLRVRGGLSSDDDDVPLAQRIPTALTAQRTIKRQVRDERQQRRKDRAMRNGGEGTERQPRSRQMTLRPAGAGSAAGMAMSSSQEAALHAATTAGQPLPRQYTATLPGRPFSPDDLARKLQNVQVAEYQSSQFSASTSQLSFQQQYHIPSFASRTSTEAFDPACTIRTSRSRSLRDPPPKYSSPPSRAPASPPPPPLRPSRSFHRIERRTFEEDRPPLPDVSVSRSVTTPAATRTRSGSRVEEPPAAISRLQRQRSYSTARERNASNAPSSLGFGEPPSVPPMPARMSMDDQHRRSPVKAPAEPPPRSSKTPIDSQRTSRPNTSAGRLQTSSSAFAASNPNAVVTQQRVFVGDMQRFNMVEITSATNAGDVIKMIEAQGSLAGRVVNGGWMLWEVAQDFGMERPIRSFELLSDVQASWNKDKMMNTFVVRMTPLAIPLSLGAMPTSSPTHSGYVEWEVKRGKWSKRWMQLREHCLWLSKRDNRKDEVMLCSLSTFDAYHFIRAYRAPKPFAFAVKSTDKLSFFENTADYLHNFSCKEADGKIWMEKILVARSYVLHQERQVLFNPRVTSGNAASSLSRSGTRKTSGAHSRPIQPLISAVPAYPGATQPAGRNDVFEPGSLLYGQV